MNRRDLLRILISSPLAASVDLDKLGWVKGERVYSLPPVLTVVRTIESVRLLHLSIDNRIIPSSDWYMEVPGIIRIKGGIPEGNISIGYSYEQR